MVQLASSHPDGNKKTTRQEGETSGGTAGKIRIQNGVDKSGRGNSWDTTDSPADFGKCLSLRYKRCSVSEEARSDFLG